MLSMLEERRLVVHLGYLQDEGSQAEVEKMAEETWPSLRLLFTWSVKEAERAHGTPTCLDLADMLLRSSP